MTMKVILKWHFLGIGNQPVNHILVPEGRVLHVDFDQERLTAWVESDAKHSQSPRMMLVKIPTGHPFDPDDATSIVPVDELPESDFSAEDKRIHKIHYTLKFIGVATRPGLVWHVYQVIPVIKLTWYR